MWLLWKFGKTDSARPFKKVFSVSAMLVSLVDRNSTRHIQLHLSDLLVQAIE
jgi:hypothetical protein